MSEVKPPTEEEFAEIAAKFDVTVEEAKRQWQLTTEQGTEGVLAEMDERMSEIVDQIQAVADDAAARFLSQPDRLRAMGDFYQEGWAALSVEDIKKADKGDMFLNLTVACFMLAEAQRQIATMTDSNHRRGGS